MRLAENLNKLKRQGGFTDPQLAAYTGISTSTVRRVLSNTRGTNAQYRPAYKTVRCIAESLGVSSDDLYKNRMIIEILE